MATDQNKSADQGQAALLRIRGNMERLSDTIKATLLENLACYESMVRNFGEAYHARAERCRQAIYSLDDMQSAIPDPCEWLQDEWDDSYGTSCGNTYLIIDGTPEDNGMNYCTYCGGKLEAITTETQGKHE